MFYYPWSTDNKRKESLMNIKINSRIEAMFCLLEQDVNAARLLEEQISKS